MLVGLIIAHFLIREVKNKTLLCKAAKNYNQAITKWMLHHKKDVVSWFLKLKGGSTILLQWSSLNSVKVKRQHLKHCLLLHRFILKCSHVLRNVRHYNILKNLNIHCALFSPTTAHILRVWYFITGEQENPYPNYQLKSVMLHPHIMQISCSPPAQLLVTRSCWLSEILRTFH